MAGDIFTLDADNNAVVRTVPVNAAASETNSPVIFTTDEDGNAAVRIVGAGGGSAPVIDELNVTPSTSAQTITAPSGTDGYSPVNVAAVTSAIDANIVAENIKKDVEILGVTGSYEGQIPTGTKSITANGVYDVTDFASADVQVPGGVSGKYQLLDRIKDDNNVEIGTVSGFIKDSNGDEFAVVCLDAKYRANNLTTLSSMVAITGLTNITSYLQWTNSQTATSNCNAIINFISGSEYTSASVSHCRTNSFTIDNVTYLGQLPVILELVDIFKNRVEINNKDTSGSAYQNLLIPSGGASASLSCVQEGTNNMWVLQASGGVSAYRKTFTGLAIPVLEIPNS